MPACLKVLKRQGFAQTCSGRLPLEHSVWGVYSICARARRFAPDGETCYNNNVTTGLHTLPGWGERLLGEARLALAGTPWSFLLQAEAPTPASITTFRDESGNGRAIDPFILAWLTRTSPPPSDSLSTDLRLWNLLCRGELRKMAESVGEPGEPLAPEFHRLPIEAATEIELASLHALSHGGDGARSRVASACDWIVHNFQTNHTTRHPWAVHVFLQRAFETGAVEPRLYAEALLHNCIASLGRADRFSALLLLDSGLALRSMGTPQARR